MGTFLQGMRMDLRIAVYDLAARYGLDDQTARRLHALAGVDAEPKQLGRMTMSGIAVLGAFLTGLGIVFWIASNWSWLGRAGRFALLQGFFVVMCLGAAQLPRARPALGTLSFMTLGGLLAYFGQTYQTGADPWQLFATWSLLSLPLCFSARSDALWTAWCWVAMAGISLWLVASSDNRWGIHTRDTAVQLAGWGLSLATCALLSPLAVRATGAGKWSLRSAFPLAATIISVTGLDALFQLGIGTMYLSALAIVAAAAYVFSRPKLFDMFCLCCAGLILDVLIIGLLIIALDHATSRNLVIWGLSAAGIMGGSVHVIVASARRARQNGGHQ